MSTEKTKATGSAISVIRTELGAMTPEFHNALPSHITAERFGRVTLTAIQTNPELLEVDRRSLWKACMQAANDGLLPDGREGAIVVRWSPKGKQAAWQPMIAGVRKKAVNAGMIATWDIYAVYENDAFEYELGDDPFIRHKPALKDRGALVAAYSVATTKTGEKSREVMGVDEIFEIRDQFSTAWQSFKAGKIKSTPWQTATGEMAKKTVGHRHGKVLPLSADIRDLLLKGDELRADDAAAPTEPKSRLTLTSKLDLLAADPTPETSETIEHDAVTGEIKDEQTASGPDQGPGSEGAEAESSSPQAPASAPKQLVTTTKAEAKSGGAGKAAAKQPAKVAPGKSADYDELVLADLTQEGNRRAAEGSAALEEFLRELNPDEDALISPGLRKKWHTVAQAVART